MPQSVATFLVDGSVAGTWKVERARRQGDAPASSRSSRSRARALADVRDEGERLVRFHEPDAASFAVRVRR